MGSEAVGGGGGQPKRSQRGQIDAGGLRIPLAVAVGDPVYPDAGPQGHPH